MAKTTDVPSFTDTMATAMTTESAPVGRKAGPPSQEGLPPIPATKPEGDMPVAPPRNLFSGTTKKLEVFGKPGTDPMEPIPGHQLYWFDDVEGGLQISAALASGWRYVEKEEIALNDAPTSPGNSDIGNHVRRWVGQGGDDHPVYAYLMKKPNWLHELHMTGPESIEERVHKKQEEQLAMGTLNVNPNDRPYTARNPYPGTSSKLPPISIGRYYRRPS